MRRINLIFVLVLLAVPVAASAKVGVELEKDATSLAPGEKTDMMVMLYRDPGDRGGDPTPIVGAHPLVTFRNPKTGEVVRVRAGVTNREGMATATVAFPSRGEWTVDLGNIRGVLEEGMQPLRIGMPGTGALPPEVVGPPPDAARAAEGTSFPAVPAIVALALLMLTTGALLVRRRQEGPA